MFFSDNANSFGDFHPSDRIDWFTSADPGYAVRATSDGHLELVEAHTHDDGTIFDTKWENETELPTEPGDYYLTQNVTIGNILQLSGDFSICLNGHTININDNGCLYVLGGSSLTLYDCKDGDGISGSSSYGVIQSEGTVTINGGKFNHTSSTPINIMGGNLTINGGEITGQYGINVESGGTLIVNGGTIQGQFNAIDISGGAVEINDGIIKSTGSEAVSNGGSNEGKLTIHGGDFYAGSNAKKVISLSVNSDDGNLTLSGKPTFTKVNHDTVDISVTMDSKIVFDGALDTENITFYTDDKNQAFTVNASTYGITADKFTFIDMMEYKNPEDKKDYEVQKVGSELWLVPKGAHVHDGTIFEPWDSTDSLPTTAGNYYLKNDVKIEIFGNNWTVTGDTKLCLNGHKITLPMMGAEVPSGTSLTVYDCSDVGSIVSDGLHCFNNVNGTFTLESGTIDAGGSAEAIAGSGKIVINGGTVSGVVSGSTVTINGGTVNGEVTGNSSITITDGQINGHVSATGDLNISGGTITSSYTAVYSQYGSFALSNTPTIEGNIELVDTYITVNEKLDGGPYIINVLFISSPYTFATGACAVDSIGCFKLTDDLISAGYEIAAVDGALVARLKTYTITYDPGEGDDISGDSSTETKTHGTDITISDKIFTRSGYTQMGWSTKQGASKVEYAFGTEYADNADLTLYPVWEQNVIHFYVDGKEATGSLSLKVGESVTIEAKITPATAECGAIQWGISGEEICSIVTDGSNAKITATAGGVCTLIATADGVLTSNSISIMVVRLDTTVSAVDQTVTYGENVTITATVKKAATNGISLMANYDNKVTFKLGDKVFDTVEVDGDTATLTVPATSAKGFAIGDNTVTLEYGGNGELEPIKGSVTVTVKPKTLTAIITSTTTKTYDGTASADDLGLELKLTGVVDDDDVTATAEFAFDSADAGERTISAEKAALTGAHADYYVLDEIKPIMGKINPKPVEITWNGGNFTYDGEPHTVTAAVKNAVGDDKFEIKYEDNSAIDVGNYIAKVTDLGNENYTLNGATGIEHKWKITARSLAYAQIEIVGSYTYNGEIQTPEFIVTLGGKVLSTGNYTVAYSGEVKDANTYTMTLTGAGNYSGSASAEFEIAPKSLTANISGTFSKGYDGTTEVNDDVKIALTGVVEGDVVTATAEISYDSANAGTRKIVAKNISLGGKDAKNYTLSIKQAEVSGSITPAPIDLPDSEFIYGGEAKAVIQVSGIGETVTATLTAFSSDAGEYEYSEAAKEGCYTVELSSENYKVQSAGTLTIDPLVAILEWQGGEFTYDGNAHEVAATVKNAVDGDKFNITYTDNTATEAGDYTAKVTDLGNTNYALDNPDALKWSILPAVAEFTWVGDTFAYDGQEHSVSAEIKKVAENDGFALTYKNEKSSKIGSYTAEVTSLGNSNYTLEGSTSKTHGWSITKSALTVATLPTAAEITYGQSLSDSALTGGVVMNGKIAVSGSFAWVDGDETPAVKDSGKSFAVVFMPDDSSYDPVETEVTITVNKAVLTPKIGRIDNKVYDGNTAANGAITLSGAKFDDMPTATAKFNFVDKNAGKNKSVNVSDITLAGSWGDNYELSTVSLLNQSTSTKILPRAVEIEWAGEDFAYDGEAHTVTATVKNAVAGDKFEIAYTGNTATKAGDYTAKVTALGNANYTLESSNEYEWEITPRVAEIEWVGDEFTYDGKSHTVTATVKNAVAGDKFEIEYTGNTATEAGDYTAKVTALGNANYTLSGATGIEHEWKITALSLADADIQIVGTYTYNGEVQTPEIRVTLDGKELLSGKDYTLEYSDEVKDAGKYTVTLTGTGNYSGSASAEFEIAPKSLTARISGTLSKVYDGTANVSNDVKIALTGVVGTDDVTATADFSYDSANAGARKIVAKNISLGGKDAKNYTLSSKQAEVSGSITPAPIDLPNTEFIYGGGAKTVIQVSGIGETVTATLTAFSSDAGEYEYSETVKEGCYTVKFSSENYKVQSAGMLTIKPLVAVLEWQGGEFTYDGTVYEVTVAVENAVVGDKFEIVYTNNTATETGDYTAKVTNLGNTNYILNGANEYKWTIAPRVADIEWVSNEFTYDGKSHTVTATVKNAVMGDKFEIEYTGNTATNAGNYTAKVTSLGNANYTLNGATGIEHKWKITAASQAAPEVKIDFINETLSTDEAMEFSVDGETWHDCTASMNVAKTGWNGSALTVKIRYKKNGDHLDGEIQSLVIPARRAAPDISEATVSKSQTEITISEIPGCEYSLDGATWQDIGVFGGLDKGSTYEIHVRYKATTSAFASFISQKTVVTSSTADGTTELLPGETVAAGDGSIKNLGGEIIIDDGAGNVTTVTLPEGGSVEVDEQGNVTVPGGGEVAVGDNPAVSLPEGGKVEPDGTVTADDVKVGDKDVKGENVTVAPDGNITVPGEGSVEVGVTPEITLPKGGTVEPDGTVIADEVKVGDTDVKGENVTVTPDGNITVLGEGQVKVGDNPEIILPTGGTVEPDGTVTADEVKVGDTDVKGKDVTVEPDGNITLPEGGKVSVDGEPEKIVPAGMIIENGMINAPAIAEPADGTGSLGDDIILKIEPADERLETADRENLKDAANSIVREVYDIELLKNGVEVEPDKSIKLTVSADVDGAKMKVFMLDNDGKFTEMNAEFDTENGTFCVVTDSLGIFILASEEGQITSEVVASGGAPEVEIGDDDRKILEENLFTDDDEAAIENGNNVKVVMNVEGVSEEDVPADDIAEIEAFLGDLEGCEVAEYADITLTKITEDGVTGDEIRSEAIPEINNPIKLVFDIPESLHKIGRIFSVIRLHDGKAELLNDTDQSDETVTILTDKFSLYVLIYRDPASQPSHVHSFTSWINVGAGGHLARCAICGKVMSLMPHTMLNGVCTACGYVAVRAPAYLPDDGDVIEIEVPTEGMIANEEVVEF